MVTGDDKKTREKLSGEFTLHTLQPINPRRAIIFFDGGCSLCHGVAEFIIRRDRRRYFQFQNLKSPAVRHYLDKLGLPDPQEVVLIERGKVYTGSTASLRILRRLGGPYRLFQLLMYVPQPARDWVYRQISKRRYRWFGEELGCSLTDGAMSRHAALGRTARRSRRNPHLKYCLLWL